MPEMNCLKRIALKRIAWLVVDSRPPLGEYLTK
jgi:hypothetical protein